MLNFCSTWRYEGSYKSRVWLGSELSRIVRTCLMAFWLHLHWRNQARSACNVLEPFPILPTDYHAIYQPVFVLLFPEFSLVLLDMPHDCHSITSNCSAMSYSIPICYCIVFCYQSVRPSLWYWHVPICLPYMITRLYLVYPPDPSGNQTWQWKNMENGPFISDIPIKTSIHRGFSSQPCLITGG